MGLYRIQHPSTGHGVWTTLSDQGEPIIKCLSNTPFANKDMPYSDMYGYSGRRWYSAFPSKKMLRRLVTEKCICELIAHGLEVIELKASQTYDLTDEVIFTKESVTYWKNVTDDFVNLKKHAV